MKELVTNNSIYYKEHIVQKNIIFDMFTFDIIHSIQYIRGCSANCFEKKTRFFCNDLGKTFVKLQNKSNNTNLVIRITEITVEKQG